MNNYKSAMDKIKVTPEMQERILSNISIEMAKEAIEPVKKTPFRRWTKPVGGAAVGLCFALAVIFVYSSSVKDGPNEHKTAQIQVAQNNVSKKAKVLQKQIVAFDRSTLPKNSVNKHVVGTTAAKEAVKSKPANDILASNSYKQPVSVQQKEQKKASTNNIAKVKAKQKQQPLLASINNDAADVEKQNQQETTILSNDDKNSVNSAVAPVQNDLRMAKAKQSTTSGQENAVPGAAADKPEARMKTAMAVNPIKEVKDIDELKKEVSFEVLMPNKLPDGYKMGDIALISDKTVQIKYSSGDNEIIYRTEKGTEDISGDYTVYEKTVEVKNGDDTIKMSGNGKLISTASWTHGEYAFSLTFSAGIDQDEAMSIINSLKAIE